MRLAVILILGSSLLTSAAAQRTTGPFADEIFTRGRIVTVDDRFRIVPAMAIREGRIMAVGGTAEVERLAGPDTRRTDLRNAMLLPGLIDSHTHPTGACMTEFDHPIPGMETIADVLAYIRERARVVPKGEWIVMRQIFITRLREKRYPTRAEMDLVAPDHPVLFSTGPDASLNSRALALSGIDRNFKPQDGGPGKVELDPATGEPTGILRSLTRYVRTRTTSRPVTNADRETRLLELFADYLQSGITSIADRDASPDALALYTRLRDDGRLPLRISASHHVESTGPIEQIEAKIREVGRHPLRKEDPRLKVIGIKTYLDGGMLTGSAYMRKPWGISQTYSITDPDYRGLLFIPPDRLTSMVRAAVQSGLQFTAHSVGDGAVHTLLDAYETVNRETPVAPTRPCITHSNFMSKEAVEALPRLGVSVDIQPAWLYLDAPTLQGQFGYDRLRYFQPLRSIFRAGGNAGGGSDHMQKIGGLRSINPYNPFLGMWVAISRRSRTGDHRLHPEEAITREQAIRFYTRNNAHILFRESEVGSLEPGKRADFIQLDRDILQCPKAEIRDIRVVQTWVDGRPVRK